MNNYLYLGVCSGKCDGEWIRCDCCKGWRCYNHLKIQNDIDLRLYDYDYAKAVHFTCDNV